MAQIPSSRVENPIIQQFLQDEARRTALKEQAVMKLEMAPVEEQLAIARARAMKELGVEFIPQELAAREPFEIRSEERQEASGMRTREHSAKVQRETNRDQLGYSHELGEKRADSAAARNWGVREREKAADLETKVAQEARDASMKMADERRAIENKVAEAEALGPSRDEENRRIIDRQRSALDIRSEAQLEVQRLRGAQAQERQSYEWAEKNKFHERFPRLSAGARAGRIKFVEEGVAHVDSNDVVARGEMDADKQNFKFLGMGVDEKNKPIAKYQLLKPAPTGNFVPAPSMGPSQAPSAAPAPPAGSRNPYRDMKGGVTDPGAVAPKSGDRLQKNTEAETEYRPARLASEAPPALRNYLISAGERFNVDPDLLASHSYVESGWNPRARSPAGAEGIAQFMPATARTYGVDTADVRSSIIGMAKYMDKMGPMFDENLGLVVAGYNAGEGRAGAGNGILGWLERGAPMNRDYPRRETRDHVLKVTGKPLEYWVDKYFRGREERSRPRVEATNQTNEDGEDLFYVDIG